MRHGTTFTHHGNVCSHPHAHRCQGATCLSKTSCQQRFLVPAASVHPRDSLHEHVLPSRFALATLTVLAPAASHVLRSPPLMHVCRSSLETLLILFLTCLKICMTVFPWTYCLVLHAHPHLWVLLDITMCPPRGSASPFPLSCFSFGVYPLVHCPKDFPPQLFAVDLPPPSIISLL